MIVNKKEKKEKKRTCQIVDFSISADHRVKLKESEKRDEYLDLAREGKTMVYEGNGDTNNNWWTWNNPQNWQKDYKT